MTVDEIYDMTFRLNSKVQKVRLALKFSYPNNLEHKIYFCRVQFWKSFQFPRNLFQPQPAGNWPQMGCRQSRKNENLKFHTIFQTQLKTQNSNL